MKIVLGMIVEDEEFGLGTVVGYENGTVFIQLDPPGCRMLAVPESALEPNEEP